MKTIAQQLNITDFPFIIKDKNGDQIYYEKSNKYWNRQEFDSNGNRIYYEDSDKNWVKREFDSNRNTLYFENSDGDIIDDRPKPTCEGKIVEIDGKKYKLTEVL